MSAVIRKYALGGVDTSRRWSNRAQVPDVRPAITTPARSAELACVRLDPRLMLAALAMICTDQSLPARLPFSILGKDC